MDFCSKLFRVANDTKNALVLEWKKEKCFKDKNNLKESGLLPEGIGLCSLLIMLVAFGEEGAVMPTETQETADGKFNATVSDIEELVNKSLRQVCEWSIDRFSAAPMIDEEYDEELFTKERGYTDTVTWCLSAAILARYAERKGFLHMEGDVRDSVFGLLARSFNAIISAQREDGTWSFTTDGRGKKSLYFTYTANASLADFFDYVLDEISLVEKETDSDITAKPDTEIIRFLDDTLGIDSVEAANKARESLDRFLVQNCLPLLPKLANCQNMTPDEIDTLGIGIHAPFISANSEKFFHNLYYTYYLLDMIVTSSADRYFDDAVKDSDVREKMAIHYKNMLDEHEYAYYFDRDEITEDVFKEFFKSYYEQALHASRTNYISATRTGYDFWDSTASELPLTWEHEDNKINKLANKALDQSKTVLTDPAILAMALRANVNYSFYITEKPEVTVERLFDDICNNVCVKEHRNRVVNLWDSLYYNLPVTERSIESLVDFYDYINKFNKIHTVQGTGNVSVTQTNDPVTAEYISAPSPIDKAIEEKIAEYLCSEAGKSAISEAIGSVPKAQGVVSFDSSSILSDETLNMVQEICRNVNDTTIPNDDDPSNRIAGLIAKLVDLHEALELCRIRKIFAESTLDKDSDEFESDIIKDANTFNKHYETLLPFIRGDLKDPKYQFHTLYQTLKRLK